MRRISKFGLIPLFAALLMAASVPSWKTTPVPHWSEDDAKQFLADSPAARSFTCSWRLGWHGRRRTVRHLRRRAWIDATRWCVSGWRLLVLRIRLLLRRILRLAPVRLLRSERVPRQLITHDSLPGAAMLPRSPGHWRTRRRHQGGAESADLTNHVTEPCPAQANYRHDPNGYP